jgi:RNA polymerase sigma-70 factor (ECF subfamily)
MSDEIALPGEITRLLGEVEAGRGGAQQELFKRVYEDLRDRARWLMRGERTGHTWAPTDLAHNACLRLSRGGFPTKNSRMFFFAVARAMRQLLIEHARIPKLCKGVPLDAVLDQFLTTRNVRIEALDEALTDMETFAPRAQQIVMLRVFGGMQVKEVAELLEVAERTVQQDWTWAKSWLYTRLKEDGDDGRVEGKKYLRGSTGSA